MKTGVELFQKKPQHNFLTEELPLEQKAKLKSSLNNLVQGADS